MKLIHCPHCLDLVKLQYEERTCACGRSGGHYLKDWWHARVNEAPLVIGIANPSLVHAILSHRKDPSVPHDIRAFVIEDPCPRVERVAR